MDFGDVPKELPLNELVHQLRLIFRDSDDLMSTLSSCRISVRRFQEAGVYRLISFGKGPRPVPNQKLLDCFLVGPKRPDS
ncbi:hypothetical protein CGZ80_20320 [Rhodopirellula sp. MGV]|nr:hypothetical protein CGZ80_20320 [Rhodopirellula sp. MGV]PNY35561.1 hypothetical protein C2E31_18910 [Rhodopirellula baltica]